MKIKNHFNIGDTITITTEPFQWSSMLTLKDPLGVVKFPYSCTIVDIMYDNDHWAILDNKNYGWDLSHLIKYNNIYSLKKDRRNKLKQLLNEKKL